MGVWSKQFDGRPECLVEARQFTIAVLGEGDGAHTAALVANELAGNAIKHTASGGPGGEFVLRLARFGNRCRVQVDDQGAPTTPAMCAVDEEDEAGRGLAIVDTLSSQWGADGDEHARSVWAEITFEDVRFNQCPTIPGTAGPAAGLPSRATANRRVGTTTGDGARDVAGH